MLTKVSSYKDLVVYQKSKQLTVDVITHFSSYKLPIAKQFLLNQLFRAVGSIPANIAEGYGRNSRKSFKQFVSIARGSSFEVDCWLEIIGDIEGFNGTKIMEFIARNTEISKMLSGLMKSLSN
ncbi:MAG: S23 ribosomal protein [Candidatus Shapirobacteria bacterium GW2011_GWE1_38_10]|uniref:S23 ribosomal protein n=1 Tax=Candidatus Shapirobacteria bacterium GW2011_GWE1_38_10 TaxID=1618488 RepID=A0A0G0L6H0_9BACT|nr:MAG: S23 ribosomal protein [Candidatus Shapirobacteria bacterium GW2011_GWE1_38_10]